VALLACSQPGGRAPASPVQGETLPDTHNSRNSLDWAATYEGVGPCADCPGIVMSLTLDKDGSYTLVSRYIDRPAPPSVNRGTFTWQASGNAITLDAGSGGAQYAVREGSLAALPRAGGAGASPPVYVLKQVPRAAADRLAPTLQSNRWQLLSAVDAQGSPIARLAPRPGLPVTFVFTDDRIVIEGGCNALRGAFKVDAAKLEVGRTNSTMMACEPALMATDAALAKLVEAPLAIEIDKGSVPLMRLVSASNDRLVFAGTPTPESLYGPPTIIFFEVGAQEVPCNHPKRGATRCLQVRERYYDAQGLPVGRPGEWRVLHEEIEGFTHVEGIRNVLRLKRFAQTSTPPGGPGAVYVLDLVVESEVVQK
jgi:heat shock protein HslJ